MRIATILLSRGRSVDEMNILGDVSHSSIKRVWSGKAFKQVRCSCVKGHFPEKSSARVQDMRGFESRDR
jgi:hypothetical protein